MKDSQRKAMFARRKLLVKKVKDITGASEARGKFFKSSDNFGVFVKGTKANLRDKKTLLEILNKTGADKYFPSEGSFSFQQSNPASP